MPESSAIAIHDTLHDKIMANYRKCNGARLANLVRDGLGSAACSDQQSSQHAIEGFITANCPAADFHPADDLLSAIIGPGHLILPGKYTIVSPVLTQANEQIAQLFQGRARAVLPNPAFGDLFPEFEQAFAAFRGNSEMICLTSSTTIRHSFGTVSRSSFKVRPTQRRT